MSPELTDLARRAVACEGWRWMPGMAGLDPLGVPFRVALAHSGGAIVVAGAALMPAYPDALARMVPDFDDAATLGCLLALVREAYGDPALYVRLSDTTRQSDGVRAWEVLGWLDSSRSPDGRGGSWRGWGYASEAEALVAALEAAPA